MIRLDQSKALSYLCHKAKEHFDHYGYNAGTYNDNRFVGFCYKIYADCIIEAGKNEDGVSWDEDFDIQDFDNALWAYAYDELGTKLTKYFTDEKGDSHMPPDDEFCAREIEYIDWAFSNEACPCSWDVKKYMDVV